MTALGRGFDALNFSHDETQLLLTSTVAAATAAADTQPGKESATEPWVITRLRVQGGRRRRLPDRRSRRTPVRLDWPRRSCPDHLGPLHRVRARLVAGRPVDRLRQQPRGTSPTRATRPTCGSSPRDNPDKGRTLHAAHQRRARQELPAWSPDGRSIAFLSAEDGVYGTPQLAVIPASGGPPRILTRRPRSLGQFLPLLGRWASGSTSCTSNLGGTRPRARAAAGRQARTPARG